MAESDPLAEHRCAGSAVADTARGSPPRVRRGQMVSTPQEYGAAALSAEKANIPATTYFPRELPPEYLRRWRA